MEPACASAGPMRADRRAADRRRGAAALLSSVTSGLAMMRDPAFARERFEEELRSLVNARSLTLSDDPLAPLPPNATLFDVPVTTSSTRARLAAVFDPARTLDGWTCQLLETATHIAALVLEVERAYLRSAGHRTRPDGAAPLIGSSRAIHAVRERIARVAATDFTVLIEGESGTGKELVARQIHDLSRRHKGPFVAVNCAAIVETLLEAELFGIEERTATGVRGRRGKFEHAHEGTLFLDEVSDLSPAAQAKLLRAIQDLTVERVGSNNPKRVDTRIIVATNKPLSGLVDTGRFRLDLYYRLHGVEVQVPPLRDRREDTPLLAQHFLRQHAQRYRKRLTGFESGTMQMLLEHPWPGNVRELDHAIERAVLMAAGPLVKPTDLGLRGGREGGGRLEDMSLEEVECFLIKKAMTRFDGNVSQAAKALGLSRSALYRRLQRYGL